MYIEFPRQNRRSAGEHKFHSVVERGPSGRLQHCHVSKTAEDERRTRPSNPDKRLASDHLGHRAFEREARGQLSLGLSENRPLHRFW